MPDGGVASGRAELLAGSDLARTLGPDALVEIAGEMRTVSLAVGDVLVAQGDAADELYVLLAGELEVVLGADASEQVLSRLEPGATVGEIALLAGDERSATVRASAPSTVTAISAVGFRRLLVAHPMEAERLARHASERLRETQLVGQLNSLFGNLDTEVLTTIKDLMEWVPVRAGTRLFQEGDEGDAAYLVVTGRLRAFRTGEGGVEVEVGEIGRSEIAGEMALLEDSHRTATVYAVRDSQLVRFSRAAFDALVARYPAAGLAVAHTVLRRTGHLREARPQHLSVAFVAGSTGVDADALGRQLAEAFGPEARYVDRAAIEAELGRPGIADVDDDDVGAVRLSYWLEELQERNRFLVYGLDPSWSAWSRRALRWSDQVLVVADAGSDPQPGAYEAEMWRLIERQKHPKVALALVHAADIDLPSGTRRWIDLRPVSSHHHLRRGDPVSLHRLARLLSGRGTSIVLGGGGARGFAHLGVLAALEELNVPIDMIGGTSIGAIMAAGPAMGWTAEEVRQLALEQFRHIFDYTLPSVSVLKGHRIATKLRARFGDIDIADLWIPYFCVSTNLTTAGARYHDRGPLVDAIRASIAIPGVLPPVPFEGELHVDGGILDNVPVDEMRRRNPSGQLVAIDVAPADGPRSATDDGITVSGIRALLGRRRAAAAPPGLLTTVVRSMLIASVRDRDRVVDERVADLYVDVSVDGGGLLDFSTAEHIASTAESSVRPVLRRWARSNEPDDVGYVRATASTGTVLSQARRRWRGYGMLLLTIRDLQHRAVRFAAVIAGTSVVLALLFLMTGLIEQFHLEPEDTVDALGAEAWVVRDGVSGAFTAASTMPDDTASALGAGAAPVVVARHSINGASAQTDVVIIGFRSGGLGQPEVESGALPAAAGEVVVDDSAGVSPGDEITLGSARFRVTGTTDRTTMFAGMPLVFMDLGDAQELVYRGQPIATAVLLPEVPESAPDGFAVRSPDEIATDGLRPLDGAISSIEIIRVLLWFVAAMIIGTMVYLSALERRRDVAVLKAVGGSTGQMAGSIALQGALTALAAALIAAVLQLALVPVFPLEVSVPTRAFYQIPITAVLVSLLAGAVGLRKAVGTDPALAFAGPGS
ncbi:MAG TPA: cyclic nucleotide-binding domain-containing protein [Acidimicrobiales bacterium]|nr:cyclic nucleotide-binding domain-containing protein [Acidimicrobiales bacterium]